MEYRDYYATLGGEKGASQADIKKAFRRLARENHPDVNKGDAAAEKRFKEISEANEVLSDPEKRKAYDQLGANWQAYQQAGGAGAAGSPFAGFSGFGGGSNGPGGVRFEYRGNAQDLSGFSDFFRTFFGGGAGGGGAGGTGGASHPDIDALFGGAAGGAAPGYGPAGAGGTRRAARPPDAIADATITLEEVQHGTVRHLEVGGKTLEVKIPPGVRDGQRIRLSGKAEGGGDVYIKVRVARHPVFTRDGSDLSMDLSLTLGEALLGSEVHISTLSGKKLALTIPPGTQNGRVFKLSGQGLPHFNTPGAGDLRVRTKVVLPTFLDDEGREMARTFIDHIEQTSPRTGSASPTG